MAEEKIEERDVTADELKSGVKLNAGHKVVLILGGSGHGKGDEPAEPSDPPADPDAPGDQPPNPDQPDPPPAASAPADDKPPEPAPAPTPHDAPDVQIVSASRAPQRDLELEVAVPDGTKQEGRSSAAG